MVKVRLADWRHGSFDAHMRGVAPITHVPQEVADSKQDELAKRAARHGVELVFDGSLRDGGSGEHPETPAEDDEDIEAAETVENEDKED